MTKIQIFTCNKEIPVGLEQVIDRHFPNSKLIVSIDDPEVINKALPENPAVIISYIPISILDTPDVINHIKKQALQKNIPAILLANPEDNPETLKATIDGSCFVVLYLPIKPLELVTLINTLTKGKISGKNSVNGDVFGSIEVNSDITTLQQSEEALRISKEKFRSIVDSSPNGLYFYELDDKDDLIFSGANPSADRTIGLDHKILLGKRIEEAFPNLTQTFIPQLYRKIAKGETNSESFELEYHDNRANGFFDVTVYKTGFNSIAVEFSDITSSKQAEKALSESEEKYRRLFETMNQGVVYQSSDGFIISANNAAEQILGLTLDQMRGKSSMDPDWKAIYEDGRNLPGSEHPSMRAIATGKKIGPVVIGVFHPIRKNHIWISIVAIPLFKPGEEKPYQVYTVFEDISQQKEANEIIRKLNDELEQRVKDRTAMLEASNKELEAFAYSISHDLRTPLRAINSFATILANDYALYLDDEARRICSVISDNASKMGKLIDGLLNFSRLNRAALLKSQIDMNNLVILVCNELSEFLNTQQVQISIAPDLHPAYADLVLIKQVWVNLIDNAIKFTSLTENPKIEIKSYREAGKIIYCVIDNGVGFNMQYINKLFDIFHRLHNEKEFKGTGIGLALVQRIAQRHGGEIWAESEPGKGAAFYFSLPEISQC